MILTVWKHTLLKNVIIIANSVIKLHCYVIGIVSPVKCTLSMRTLSRKEWCIHYVSKVCMYFY